MSTIPYLYTVEYTGYEAWLSQHQDIKGIDEKDLIVKHSRILKGTMIKQRIFEKNSPHMKHNSILICNEI